MTDSTSDDTKTLPQLCLTPEAEESIRRACNPTAEEWRTAYRDCVLNMHPDHETIQ